jgi:type I restriction enzyme M protein
LPGTSGWTCGTSWRGGSSGAFELRPAWYSRPVSDRKDSGEEGRFRKFTCEAIKARGNNLDITWLKDEGVGSGDDLPEPEEIAAEITELLRTAMEEMEGLRKALEVGA